LIHRKTTISQKLSEEYEEKLINFQKFVISLRKKYCSLLSQIGNTYQTPVWFDMPELTTIEHVGKRSVQVRMTGADKQRCIMMLTITADGHKLPPFVIFRKKLPKDIFPLAIIVRVQERGWMTEELILEWLNVVWERRPGALLCKRSILVLDSFHGHMTVRVKAKVNEDSDLVVIPGGMTKLLQPLDVVINWPFKVAFWWLYNQWMTTTKHELRPSSRMKCTPLLTVCEWILAAWHSVSPEIVEKSFKVTGISMKWMGMRIS
jgi:hypothetical protein